MMRRMVEVRTRFPKFWGRGATRPRQNVGPRLPLERSATPRIILISGIVRVCSTCVCRSLISLNTRYNHSLFACSMWRISLLIRSSTCRPSRRAAYLQPSCGPLPRSALLATKAESRLNCVSFPQLPLPTLRIESAQHRLC